MPPRRLQRHSRQIDRGDQEPVGPIRDALVLPARTGTVRREMLPLERAPQIVEAASRRDPSAAREPLTACATLETIDSN